jgi:putative peptidoglycan lipid II flippase
MAETRNRAGQLASTALGAGGLLALCLVAGRLSGLVREIALAAELGVSSQADLAIVLLTLPDLLANILIAGGLSAAFVPRARALDRTSSDALFRTTAFWAFISFTLVAAVLASSPDALVVVVAPGLPIDALDSARLPVLLVAISLPLTALSGVTGAFLNARDRFLVVGLGTLIFNLAIITGLVLDMSSTPLVVVGVAILVGGILRLGSQAFLLPLQAISGKPRLHAPGREYASAFAFGVLASALALAPPALVRAAASVVAPGFIATFNYAQKLVEFPVGVIATSVGTIALTRLSAAYSESRDEDAARFFLAGMRLALVLSILVVILGMFAAEAVVTILYGRGAIDANDIETIAKFTRVILFGMPFTVLATIIATALNAQRQTGRVLKATVGSFVLLCFLALPAATMRSADLLIAAMVLSQISLCVALWILAGVRLWGKGGLVDSALLAVLAVALIISAATIVIGLQSGIRTPWATVLLTGGGFATAAFGAYLTARQRDPSFGGRKGATDASA